MTEYENEPIAGLPGLLPPGEQILWQGSPDWRMLARTAFHTRLVAGYFALLCAWAVASAAYGGIASTADLAGVMMTAILGIVGLALLHLLAWGSARTTIYTLTNRRIVLRIGIAVPKCVNLPLSSIRSVGLAEHADGSGDLPLALAGAARLGYLALWPHARPWEIVSPQPMLRAVPAGARIAAMVARTCQSAAPLPERAPQQQPAVARDFAEAAAA